MGRFSKLWIIFFFFFRLLGSCISCEISGSEHKVMSVSHQLPVKIGMHNMLTVLMYSNHSSSAWGHEYPWLSDELFMLQWKRCRFGQSFPSRPWLGESWFWSEIKAIFDWIPANVLIPVGSFFSNFLVNVFQMYIHVGPVSQPHSDNFHSEQKTRKRPKWWVFGQDSFWNLGHALSWTGLIQFIDGIVPSWCNSRTPDET